MDMYGKPIKKKTHTVYKGVNSLRIENVETLAKGIYILQVQDKENVFVQKVMKN
jgi:hypothetical protein